MTNPILAEIQGLSPGAKGALQMAGHAVAASSQPPPTPAPGMLLPQSNTPPAPLSLPPRTPQLVTGPDRGQAVMTSGQSVPMGTTIGDQAERSRLLGEGSGISQINSKIENSRLGQAHPFLGKLLGGLARGAATAGDIGLSAVAPEIAINTPGTEYHHEALVNHANRAVTQDESNAEKEAQTGDLQSQTAERAADAEAKLNPAQKPVPPEEWNTLKLPTGDLLTGPGGQVIQQNKAGELRAVELPQGASLAPKPAATGHSSFDEWSANPEKFASFEKSMGDIKAEVAAEHPQQAKNASFMNIYAAQRFLQMAYTHNPALLPVASQMIGKLLNLSPEQTAQMGQVPENQPLSPETGDPIGTSMPEAPTAGTRAQAQTAARVLTELPRIRQEVSVAASHLGPAEGRATMGFLLGTVGSTGNPTEDRNLSELKGDLTFTGSAAAKFHLNSVRAMETYDKLLNSGKSTSEAIQGTLDSVEKWARTAQGQERGHGETGNSGKSEAPKAGDVEGGYRFKGGDPAKQTNWEKVP